MVKSMEVVADITHAASEGTQNMSASTEEQLAAMEEITASSTSLTQMAEELLRSLKYNQSHTSPVAPEIWMQQAFLIQKHSWWKVWCPHLIQKRKKVRTDANPLELTQIFLC